jgi:hypothetical protein
LKKGLETHLPSKAKWSTPEKYTVEYGLQHIGGFFLSISTVTAYGKKGLHLECGLHSRYKVSSTGFSALKKIDFSG